MRHHVEPGAVAHRRGMQDGVAGRGGIHLGQICKARLREIAMGEHRAFRAARGARGVEQPGEVVAVTRRDRASDRRRTARHISSLPMTISRSRLGGRVWRDFLVEARRRETDARAGMFEDVAELAPVQLGVRRHRSESAVPDAVDRLDIFDAVLRDDRDAIAGLQPEPVQRIREPRRALGKRAVALRHACAIADRRKAGVTQTRARSHAAMFTNSPSSLPGFDPAIHQIKQLFLRWMRGSSPRMTRWSDRVQPAEMDRIALAAEQRHRLVERQADHIAV